MSGEAKHTPGPWCVPDVGTSLGTVTVSAGDLTKGVRLNGLIAQADAGSYARSQEEGLANARLIAAAPDLYEVCKAYEKWEADLIMCDSAWRDSRDGQPVITEPLLERMRELQDLRNAALAKADGATTN